MFLIIFFLFVIGLEILSLASLTKYLMMHKLTQTANRNKVLIINYACNLESKTKNIKIKREKKTIYIKKKK